MNTAFHVIIPARYASMRLPKKLLLDLGGMSVLERTYRQALASGAQSVTIATEHPAIEAAAQAFGASVIMTSDRHQSGTERAAEAVKLLGFAEDTLVVNLQGDEPFMPAEYVHAVAEQLAQSDAPVTTLISPIRSYNDFISPSIVKVMVNAQQHAQLFSRSPIPFCRDNPQHFEGSFRHFGIYAYRAGFLAQYTALSPSPYESIESLEQLRVLWHGHAIAVREVERAFGLEINTQEELDEARLLIEQS